MPFLRIFSHVARAGFEGGGAMGGGGRGILSLSVLPFGSTIRITQLFASNHQLSNLTIKVKNSQKTRISTRDLNSRVEYGE